MARQLSKKIIEAKWTKQPRDSRNPKRLGLIDAQHPEGLGVVADRHRAALRWPPIQALFSDRNVLSQQFRGYVGVEQTELVDGGKRSGGLQRVVIDEGDHLPGEQRVRGRRRRVLIFPVDVEGKPSILGAGGESGRVVKALLIGPAVIVRRWFGRGCCR